MVDFGDDLGDEGFDLFDDHGADGAAHGGESHGDDGVAFVEGDAINEAEVDDTDTDFWIDDFIGGVDNFFDDRIFSALFVECFGGWFWILFVVDPFLEIWAEDGLWRFFGGRFGDGFFNSRFFGNLFYRSFCDWFLDDFLGHIIGVSKG